MIRLKNHKALQALALFLAFSLTQIYVHASLTATTKRPETIAAVRPQTAGKLVTRGNQSVLVNGTSASTGASILTGATIETGDGVGATINLGPLGSVDLAPNTKVVLEYSSDGGIRLRLLGGCTILRNRRGTRGEISTEQGVAIKDEGSTSDTSGGAPLDVCFPPGAPSPIVQQGAAANAGAGASGGAVGTTAGTGGGGLGFGTAGTVALIIGIGAAVIIPIALTRGDDPSPSNP